MKYTEYMLTTTDNPINPFDDYDSWLSFDIRHGYNTPAVLARIARTSDELTAMENAQIVKEAIEDLVKHDFQHLYKLVSREIELDLSSAEQSA